MPRTDVQISSLMAATDVDVLPDTASVEDRGDHVIVRTPSNPTYHWGNFLLSREPYAAGDAQLLEQHFDAAFETQREYRHCAIAWDVPTDGELVRREFSERGYAPDTAVALVAEPADLVPHARANSDVEIRALDPDGDAELWDAVVELQVESREPGHEEQAHRAFVVARMQDRRARFRAGDGAWLVALLDGEVAASCGIVVTAGRCRYQAVDTAPRFRRRGIARRLVHDAGRLALDGYGAHHLVIVADADYHAMPLYQSLGFAERERVVAVCWWSTAPEADRHPAWGEAARPLR